MSITPRPVGGWPKLRSVAPTLIAADHQNGLDGCVVLADSDDSPVADGDAAEEVCAKKARLGVLRRAIDAKTTGLRARAGKPPIHVAIGLAVPSLEAWCLSVEDGSITEAVTRSAVRERRAGLDRDELKQRLYGSARPSSDVRVRRVRERAERIAADLDRFEKLFPVGFGSLRRGLDGWRT